MLKKTKLPAEIIAGTSNVHRGGKPGVEKCTFDEGIDEIQYLNVAPWTAIKMHGHDNKQWEVWVNILRKTAYVCLIGEEHELVNNSAERMILMVIKGHVNYSYDDIAEFFYRLGFSVHHGSLIVND